MWITNHYHEVLIVIVEIVNDIPHSLEREAVRVQGHDVTLIHVVDWIRISRVSHENVFDVNLLSVHMVSSGMFAAE